MNNTVSAAPLNGSPTVTAAANLGTTQTLIALDPDEAGVSSRARRRVVKIVNPNATAVLAYTVVPKGDTPTPAIVATYAANAGSHITPGATEYITLPSGADLWLVADAAASSYSVTSFIEG